MSATATLTNDDALPSVSFTVANVTASEGSMVIVTALTFSFPAGTTSVSKYFDLAYCGGFEADETFILTLGTPTNAVLGSSSVHTTTITDSGIDDSTCGDPLGDPGVIIITVPGGGYTGTPTPSAPVD